MIFSNIEINGKRKLCCVDQAGERAFLVEEFFQRDLKNFCITSNQTEKVPEIMDELIQNYNVQWTDDMALFFGSRPELAIPLDLRNDWRPLVDLVEAWSPLQKTRGLSLLQSR